MKQDSFISLINHKTCVLFAGLVCILLLPHKGFAQFPTVSPPQPYSVPRYGNIPGTPSPQPNTPRPNGIPGDNRRIQEQNARLEQERLEYMRRMQMQQAQQMQIQEAVNELEPKTGLNMDVCRSVIRMPDYSSRPGTNYFHNALGGINKMLTGESPVSLKDAVFMVENAYYENTLNYEEYNDYIKEAVGLIQAKIKQQKLNPKDNTVKTMMAFHFMTDTFKLKLSGREKTLVHYPMTYDMEDPGGEKDYSKRLVTKLMATNKGQCATLPRLFLIFTEAMGAQAYQSMSAMHDFVKIQDKKGEWYNLELTSGAVYNDHHYLLSGFIKAEALRNKLYLEPLTLKETVADILLDLAGAYINKYGYDEFAARCCYIAQQYAPNNIRAYLIQANYLTSNVMFVCEMAGIRKKEQLAECPQAKRLHQLTQDMYAKIASLGYEAMPRELYQQWLERIDEEKDKPENRQMKLNLITQ